MTAPSPPAHAPHWAGLDGIRGLAALAVVVFHASLGSWGANGYTGVDVFFGLSGFLITSLLLEELRATGRIHLLQFYGRRALRLYPALLAAVVAVCVLGVVGGALDSVLPGAIASLAYIANWWLFTGHEMPMLEHTWTLAIEEHFYLLWPALLLLLVSRRLRLTGLIVAGALILLLVWPWPDAFADVKYTYLRGSAIVWGSALAFALRIQAFRSVAAAAAPWLAIPAAMVVMGVLAIPYRLPEKFLTGPAGLVGWGTIIVVAAVVLAPRSAGVAWLTWRPLRWAGRRSYGIYLYHFPILSLLRHQLDVGPVSGRMVLGIILTLLVAEASYRWWEKPFLRLKDRLRPQAGPETAAQPKPAGQP